MSLWSLDSLLGGVVRAVAAVVVLLFLWFYFSSHTPLFYLLGGIVAGFVLLYVAIAIHHTWVRPHKSQ